MKLAEFIFENVNDTRDIHLASQWLANRIVSHRMKPGKIFTVHDIFKLDGGDTLPIDYSPTSEILLDDELQFLIGKSKKNIRGNIVYGAFVPNRNLIYINKDLLKYGNAELTSVIVHELRHALDFLLSKGRVFRKKENNQTLDTYIKSKVEINARFTEAMWKMLFDIIKTNPTSAQDAVKIIDNCLYDLYLDRRIFPQGSKGDQQYNRLRSRAIKYWMETAKFVQFAKNEKLPKQTIIDKIKSIISKFKFK